MAPRIWLIAGPTASGKSALALALAERIGAEIVGADSMQLYADLAILTARPAPAETARVPHHLVGVADAADAWSTGRWLRAAQGALADIAARGKPAVVVGGTGLYFRALTDGLADIPPIPADVRRQAEAMWAEEGETAVRARLGVSAAHIAAADRQRLVRALEVLEATGRPLTAWQAETPPGLDVQNMRVLALEMDRSALYQRCNDRLTAMISVGALDEVAALMARNLDPMLPAMKSVGVREFAAHLRGEIPLNQARESAQQETRRYAKRQMTWIRNQMADWPKLSGAASTEDQLAQLLAP